MGHMLLDITNNYINMSININPELNEDLVCVLFHLVINLQRQYCISPNLISTFINHSKLLNNWQFLQKQLGVQFEQEHDKINSVSVQKNERPLGLDDICGHKICQYLNGFGELCNQHRHFHENTDHTFQSKTMTQYQTEQNYLSVHKLY